MIPSKDEKKIPRNSPVFERNSVFFVFVKTVVCITLLTNVLWIQLFLQYYWMYDNYTDMQEAMVVSYQKITHLQKISYHNTLQRRYDIYQIKIRDMRGIMRCKVLQDNTSNKHLTCIDSILQDMLSIDIYLVDIFFPILL